MKDTRHKFLDGWTKTSDGKALSWADNIRDSVDAFGKNIVKNYKNVADIGSHYPHSPERKRLFVNGSEVLLQYGSSDRFEDTEDSYILKPQANDAIEYRTAERFRYVVNYIIEVSSAFRTNQSLQEGDKVVIGYGDADLANNMANANGWFREWRDTGSYLTTYRNGDLLNEKKIDSVNHITDWQRIEDTINWYNVGNRVHRETYTDDGEQINNIVGKTSVDGDKGPSKGNFPYVFGVVAGPQTNNLELETGSVGVNIIGDIEPIFRVKESTVEASHSGGGEWEALFAVRIDPNRNTVFVNLSDVEIGEVSVETDVELLAIAVNPTRTNATGFAVPEYQTVANSVIQQTTNVSTFPNASGTAVSTSATIGGFQLGYTAFFTAGTGTNRRRGNVRGIRKRSISNGDIVVFIAKASSAVDIKVNYETEQQW